VYLSASQQGEDAGQAMTAAQLYYPPARQLSAACLGGENGI
jgi:hypothetical protein